MFSEDLLELIFSDEEVRTVPIGCQATVIHAIEHILEDNNYILVKEE